MKNPNITPEEIGIIKKAQAGDISAFNKLFKKYKRFVDHVLFSYIKDMDEAKDITNIVFLKVFNKLSTFTDYSSFGGWLRIIANRTAIDYLRQTAIKNQVFEDNENKIQLPEFYGRNENDLINQMTYDQIIKEFKNLPENHRKVNELFYVNNMKIPQIGKTLRMSEGTIKSILSRTRNKLKKRFNKQL